MAGRSLSADDISIYIKAFFDTSSTALIPTQHMESTTSSTRQPADGAHSPPSSISSSSAFSSFPQASSSSSSYTIFSGPEGVQGMDQQTQGQSSIRDRMLTVLHIRKTIKRLTFVVAILFLLLGLMCLVTAGLTLVIPQHTDSAVAQQMVNTLFTMLNIAGVLCIVQGVSWSSKGPSNPRLDAGNLHQYPMWSRTPFMRMHRGPNTQPGVGQTAATTSL